LLHKEEPRGTRADTGKTGSVRFNGSTFANRLNSQIEAAREGTKREYHEATPRGTTSVSQVDSVTDRSTAWGACLFVSIISLSGNVIMVRVCHVGCLLAAWVLHGFIGFARGDDWPAWRGPAANGVSREVELPLTWSPEEHVRWKIALPGPGNSTPIILGDRVYLTQATDKGKQRSLICFNRKDGSQVWQKSVEFTATEPTHNTNPFCSASPVTDGERIVVSHGSAGLFCYDLDGHEQWQRELGPCHHIWGNAASPVIHGELVYLNFGPGERTFLLAVDKRTGKDAWRADEPGGKLGDKGQPEWIGSWSTPVVAKIGARDEVILSWPGVVKAYHPQTGAVLWTCAGLSKDKATDSLVYTTPLVSPEVVIAMGGFQNAWLGLRPLGPDGANAAGDITAAHRLWRHPSAPQRIGSGVIVGDHVYMVNEPGTAQCIEWKTGKILWTERATSTTWANLVLSEGRLYTTSLDGETVVFAAQPDKLEILARNKIPERTLASLAPAHGAIYLRTYNHLWCLATTAEQK